MKLSKTDLKNLDRVLTTTLKLIPDSSKTDVSTIELKELQVRIQEEIIYED